MDLVYSGYAELLDGFIQGGYRVATIRQAATEMIDPPILILRHDVEWNAERALAIAAIERSLNVTSTFYFRVDTKAHDLRAMARLQDDGFDIGYHYNCMDRARGNTSQAIELFEDDLASLRRSGIDIVTVAPHGNPRLKHVGYRGNAALVRRDPDLLSRMGLLDLGLLSQDFDRQPNLLHVTDAGIRWNDGEITRAFLARVAQETTAPRIFMLVHPDYWSDLWPRSVALHVAAFGVRTFRINAAIGSVRHASHRLAHVARGTSG